MPDNNLLDAWLKAYFRRPVAIQSAEALKQDVWRKIRIAEAEEQPSNWFERLLYSLLAPRHQIATLSVVVTLSIMLGFMTPQNSDTDANLSAKALGLDIYSSSYAHPFANVKSGTL